MEVDSDLLTLGRGIRVLRDATGLSQEELAERAGLSRNYVGLLERGERNASATALIAIARALGARPGDLWSGFGK
ncbi:MAG: helix-turn-helix domain-containing protein [Phenylobacterium sp.]